MMYVLFFFFCLPLWATEVPAEVTSPPNIFKSTLLEEIDSYLDQSHLNTQYTTSEEKEEFQEGCRKLVNTYGELWRSKAKVCEQFYWNIWSGGSINCWLNLCDAQGEIGEWTRFKAWASPIMQGLRDCNESKALQHLAFVWVRLGEQVDRFIPWVSTPIQGLDNCFEVKFFQIILPFWLQSNSNIENFTTWANPMLNDVCVYGKKDAFEDFSYIWVQLYGNVKDFVLWADPMIQGLKNYERVKALKDLTSVWLQSGGNVEDFTTWANPIIRGVSDDERASMLNALISVWVQLKGNVERFMSWTNPMIEGVSNRCKPGMLKDLISVWVHDGDVNKFTTWANPIIRGVIDDERANLLNVLISVWIQLKGNVEEFMTWTNPIIGGVSDRYKADMLRNLISVWGHGDDVQGFMKYATSQLKELHGVDNKIYLLKNIAYDWVKLGDRTNAFRTWGSLMLQGRYAWDCDEEYALQYLVPIWGQLREKADAFKAWATPMLQGVLSSWKRYYLKALFSTWVQLDGNVGSFMEWATPMMPKLSGGDHGYRVDVLKRLASIWRLSLKEDFTAFTQWTSLFGKDTSTCAYLNRSYLNRIRIQAAWEAGCSSRDGEESLREKKLNDLLPALWRADSFTGRTEVEQSESDRIKSLGYNLPSSQSRPSMASVIAQQIFNTIMNHGKNLLILRAADSSPELWRIYQAIYNDFYGRSYSKLVLKDKKTGQIYGETSPEDLEAALAGLPADITVNFEGVRHDEHLLERDMQTRGALISKYNADGSLRATPLIRYSQAVFTTVEKAFADLMRKKYEEQRVKY